MPTQRELIRELRRHLDAQAAQQEELMAELRRLRGQGSGGGSDGTQAMNDAIRGAGGGPAPEGGAEGMNDAIRRAAGRPTGKGDA